MGTFNEYNHFFFIGVAGTGMSAIAQYLRGIGKEVSGSDRLFAEEKMNIQTQLEDLGIKCYNQDGSGIDESIDVVVISTAIEDSNIELIKARELNIITERRYRTYCIKKNQTAKFKEGVEKSRYKQEGSNRFVRLVYRALASEIISISKASVLLNTPIDAIRNQLNLV